MSLREQFMRCWKIMWGLGGPLAIALYAFDGSLDERIRNYPL